MDVHPASIGVDIANLEMESFLESQAEFVDSPEVGGPFQGRASVDDVMDLRSGEHDRELLIVLDADIAECWPVSRADLGVEEFQTAPSDAQRPASEASISFEMHQKGAELFFGDDIG
jgi:hypothetical protein